MTIQVDLSRFIQKKTKKVCPCCHADKPLSEFYKDKSSKDGKTRKCSTCVKEYNNKHRKKRDNSAYHKMWRERNPDYFKQYYLNSKKHVT